MSGYSHRQDNLTVGTTPLQVLVMAKEGTRVVYTIKNVSTGGQTISIAIGVGTTAVINQGITLSPKESWVESIEQVFVPTNEPISIVADNAGAVVAIYERIIKS